MSSKHVRQAIKTAWATVAPTVPLVDVDNVEPANLKAPWAALDFTSTADEPESLGDRPCWLEEGEIYVNLYIDSGKGDGGLIDLAQQALDAWKRWRDPGGSIDLVAFSPVDTFPESSGLWYGATIALRYEYRYFI